MRRSSRATRVSAAAAAAGLIVMGLAGTGSAQAAPAPLKLTPGNLKPVPISKSAKLRSSLSAAPADKTMTVFVQLSGQGAADVSVKAEDLGRSAKTANGAAKIRRAQVRSDATKVTDQAKKTDSSARHLFTTTNSVPGLGMTATVRALRDVAKRSDVVKITPITPKTSTTPRPAS